METFTHPRMLEIKYNMHTVLYVGCQVVPCESNLANTVHDIFVKVTGILWGLLMILKEACPCHASPSTVVSTESVSV